MTPHPQWGRGMTEARITALTRDQWVEACAKRYMTAWELDQEIAAYFAAACADQQAKSNGIDIDNWESPDDTADEDMSYWENDE